MAQDQGRLRTDLVRTENTSRRFEALAWGLLLVLFDLNIDMFDLLPDVIGWLITIVALGLVLGQYARNAALWGSPLASDATFSKFVNEEWSPRAFASNLVRNVARAIHRLGRRSGRVSQQRRLCGAGSTSM